MIDVCVYGGTAAGCVAAITAHQEGASVVLIEPSRWLGGMLSAGIKPAQDAPIRTAAGGLTRDAVFTFGDNPHDVLRAFRAWIAAAGIELVLERRVRSVTHSGNRITAIQLETSPPDEWGVPLPASGSVADREVEAFGEDLAGVRPVTN